MKNQTEVTDSDLNSYYRQLVPFGYRDVECAIRTAIDAGKDADWAAEQVTEYMESTELTIDKIDPVYCVYDSLLQIASTEIEDLTGFDLCYDSEAEEIDVYGNFMCTSFDYKEEAREELIQKLADSNNVIIETCSEELQWFLAQIGIDQADIASHAERTDEEIEEDNREPDIKA